MSSQSAEQIMQTAAQCQQAGKFQEAISAYRQVLTLHPDYIPALCNLSVALSSCGRYQEAVAGYERVLELKPDYAEVHNNLGNLCKSLGSTDRAVMHLERAIKLMPNSALINNNLGILLKSQGHLDKALTCFRKALEIKPDYIEAHSNLLFTLNYLPDLSTEDLFKSHAEFSIQHGNCLPQIIQQHDNERSLDRKLRIGYMSGDFRQHSVAYFITPVLQHHNHALFEIFAYHNNRNSDKLTDTIRQSVDHWRPIAGISDDLVEQLIRNDRIDILVDLSGHTAHNRMLVFARKAAPIQVTWIGYPATTGLPKMDYRITDNIVDPAGSSDRYYTEKLIRLPECFSVYQEPPGIQLVGKLPALKNGYITFCSFNNMAKTHTGVLALWANILSAIPGSRLILKCRGLEIESTREYVNHVFAARGISTHRLDLLGTDASTGKHLQRYNDVDIGLDPFPYNGTTTTCEAAIMGVPVITLRGDRHAGRVGASLMHNLQLDELVADSLAGYVNTAVKLAADIEYLKSIRSNLRNTMRTSPLMNTARFTISLEKAYRKVWGRWCAMTENNNQKA